MKRVHFVSHFKVFGALKKNLSLDLFGSFLRQGKNEQAITGNVLEKWCRLQKNI